VGARRCAGPTIVGKQDRIIPWQEVIGGVHLNNASNRRRTIDFNRVLQRAGIGFDQDFTVTLEIPVDRNGRHRTHATYDEGYGIPEHAAGRRSQVNGPGAWVAAVGPGCNVLKHIALRRATCCKVDIVRHDFPVCYRLGAEGADDSLPRLGADASVLADGDRVSECAAIDLDRRTGAAAADKATQGSACEFYCMSRTPNRLPTFARRFSAQLLDIRI
jgi:hypothetical protein